MDIIHLSLYNIYGNGAGLSLLSTNTNNMKNKILVGFIIISSILLVGNVYAENGFDSLVAKNDILSQKESKISNKEKFSATSTKIKNSTTTDDLDEDDNDATSTKPGKPPVNVGSERSQERRSEVANAVHELLQVADRTGGIGEQIRIIAQNQNKTQEDLENSLVKIESRSKFTKFFIGPNYSEISRGLKLLEQNLEQIKELDKIKTKLMNETDKQNIALQIQNLEKVNEELKNSLGIAKKGFSLFGWISRIFSD